jgi:hypothetical protein
VLPKKREFEVTVTIKILKFEIKLFIDPQRAMRQEQNAIAATGPCLAMQKRENAGSYSLPKIIGGTFLSPVRMPRFFGIYFGLFMANCISEIRFMSFGRSNDAVSRPKF